MKKEFIIPSMEVKNFNHDNVLTDSTVVDTQTNEEVVTAAISGQKNEKVGLATVEITW